MPMFVCDSCNSVENTALGVYWTKDMGLFGEEFNGKALCSECSPETYYDGSINKRGGKWHGRFPKREWDGDIKSVINRK